MNEQNLRVPSSSEARENGKKGGIRSGEVRRERKAQQEAILKMLSSDFGGKTVFERMIGGMAKRVIENGDQAAFEKLMEYAGLSVRLDLLQEDRKLKREELRIKKAQTEQKNSTASDVEDLSGIWGMINDDQDADH